jgi:hypothetical protein
MKKSILFLLFLLLTPTVEAGVWPLTGYVKLKSGEEVRACEVAIFSMIEYAPGTYKAAYSGGIERFVKEVEPKEFELRGMHCPMEEKARVECLREECANLTSESCQIICTTFKAPLLFSTQDQKIYDGGVKSVAKIRAATIVSVAPFSVVLNPYRINDTELIIKKTSFELSSFGEEEICFWVVSGYPSESKHEIYLEGLNAKKIEPKTFTLKGLECEDTAECEGNEDNRQRVCITLTNPFFALEWKEVIEGKIKDKILVEGENYEKEVKISVAYVSYGLFIVVLVVVAILVVVLIKRLA